MLGLSPPQPLAFRTLPFRALASLAARSPMGGEREVVLGCFMAARLIAFAAHETDTRAASDESRSHRAAAARTWFAGLALPATLRTLFAKLVDATAGNDRAEMARLLSAMNEAVGPLLDEPAHAELERLATMVSSKQES